MMILSRIWYVILALFLAAAYYIVALAVGQYNRRNEAAMEETVKADSQVVSWALQIDARRRLDNLLLPAVDPAVAKAVRSANGKDAIPAAARGEGAKALAAFNDTLPPDYRNDALFIADREGRLVAQVGYDAVNAFPEFELGGYPAVFDALHGFLRDDTWVWGGKIARVVARPIEDEVGQPPLGAVVAIRWVDNSFAKEIGRRARTNIAFFALGQRVASAATTEGFDERTLEALGSDLSAVMEDEGFKETGRTDVRRLGNEGGALFARIPGEAGELGAGFAVARSKVAIDSPMGFISGADDTDKKNVKLWLVLVIAGAASVLGLLFSWLEHSMPMRELRRQAAKLKAGQLDVFQLPRFRGGYRPIAADINAGIERVVEKGGGAARKPADLESILGPVPAQPSMSAFSFPLDDAPSAPELPRANGAGPPPPAPSAAASRPGAPPPPSGARPPGAPPLARPVVGAPPQTDPLLPSPGPAAFAAPPPFPGAAMDDEDEQTRVATPPSDLISASAGQLAAPGDPSDEWRQVYDDFLRTKRECGEPTEGLSYEKFQHTLKKNRDALIERHGCKHVRFSVYVKEGRASLKATPVRD